MPKPGRGHPQAAAQPRHGAPKRARMFTRRVLTSSTACLCSPSIGYVRPPPHCICLAAAASVAAIGLGDGIHATSAFTGRVGIRALSGAIACCRHRMRTCCSRRGSFAITRSSAGASLRSSGVAPHAPDMLGTPGAGAANEAGVVQPRRHHLGCADPVSRLVNPVHKPREHSKRVAERPDLSPVVLNSPPVKLRKNILQVGLSGRREQAAHEHVKATVHNTCTYSAAHARSQRLPGVSPRPNWSTSAGSATPGVNLRVGPIRRLALRPPHRHASALVCETGQRGDSQVLGGDETNPVDSH